MSVTSLYGVETAARVELRASLDTSDALYFKEISYGISKNKLFRAKALSTPCRPIDDSRLLITLSFQL